MTAIDTRHSSRSAYQRLEGLVEQAEKVKQIALVTDVHELHARGYSVRQTAEALGVSKSSVSRALQASPPPPPGASVIEAAAAFLAASSPLARVGAPGPARTAPPSDVVVFDVMREALTTCRADYAQLQKRARLAGDEAGKQDIIERTVALVRSVDAIDPDDQDAQISMTRELRELHQGLRAQIAAA